MGVPSLNDLAVDGTLNTNKQTNKQNDKDARVRPFSSSVRTLRGDSPVTHTAIPDVWPLLILDKVAIH